MRVLAVVFCVLALGACRSEPALLGEDEARSVLQQFADDDESVGHVCDGEGNARMRHAARSYAAAHEARGEMWPNAERLRTQTSPSMSNIESYVIMMMMYGFITPAELGQDARLIAQRMEDAPIRGWDFEIANLRRLPECRLAYGVMRESWAAVLEVAPIQRQIERASERRDYGRVQRLAIRRNRIIARVQARQEEVRRQIEEMSPAKP